MLLGRDDHTAWLSTDHHLVLERRAGQALTAQDFTTAFKYADRRCRIDPPPAAHCFVLRAEAAWRLGRRGAALDDLAEALSIDPSNIGANRRMLSWAEGDDRRAAAARLIVADDDPGLVRSAIAVLDEMGERHWAAVSVFDNHVAGWVAWRGEAHIEASLSCNNASLTSLLDPDPFHPLASRGIQATSFRLRRPPSENPQRLTLSHSGAIVLVRRLPPNLGSLRFFQHAENTSHKRARVPPTVVVPVYRDREATVACLESLLKAAPAQLQATNETWQRSFRVLAVDDASPDPMLRTYLAHLAREKRIDFATRSTHLMTVRSKQIIEAFYGERPNYSYFQGCSTGGGQGIHEALQFPGDYDGIVARAPNMNRTHNGAAIVWNYQAFNGLANITTAQATAITAAVVKQCAGKDGGLSSDNFLTDPRDCHWDPASLQCTGEAADAATCLTAPQVAAMRKFYEGPINPRTGKRIHAGRTRGSESYSGYPAALAQSSFTAPYWVFGSDFDELTFDFDRDMDTLDDALAARLNANTADLEEFKSHGGKLLLFNGYADPEVPTLNTIAYYERLIISQTRGERHDEREQKEFARLFLQPGVAHCNGGAGPDSADLLSPLGQWVEQGIAPDQIIASKIIGGVTAFTRPLCPYPALPRYSGVGDPAQASSFVCAGDRDHDDNQPSAPKYLNDGDNYPIVPIDDRDHGHDRRDR